MEITLTICVRDKWLLGILAWMSTLRGTAKGWDNNEECRLQRLFPLLVHVGQGHMKMLH